MIVDTNAKIIVMVTNLIENGKVTSVTKRNFYFSFLPILSLVPSSYPTNTPFKPPLMLFSYSTDTPPTYGAHPTHTILYPTLIKVV